MTHKIGSGSWLRQQFPEKDWHEHLRADGQMDWCDGTPSDCITKERVVAEDPARQYRLRLAVPGVPIVDGCVDLIVPSLAIFEWEVVTVKRDDEAIAWLREHGVDVRVTPA